MMKRKNLNQRVTKYCLQPALNSDESDFALLGCLWLRVFRSLCSLAIFLITVRIRICWSHIWRRAIFHTEFSFWIFPIAEFLALFFLSLLWSLREDSRNLNFLRLQFRQCHQLLVNFLQHYIFAGGGVVDHPKEKEERERDEYLECSWGTCYGPVCGRLTVTAPN